ncbi:MAG TPA: hypothetical protein VIN10_07080, partial [Bacteroidales bacterium]
CKKQNSQQQAQIEILSPKENAFYSLPDTIHSEIIVQTDVKPDYIRVCVCNAAQTPVFSPIYFYPETLLTNLSFDYILENMDISSQGQLYFSVSVATDIMSNSFKKINIESQPVEFQGVYLFTHTSVNETKLAYLDIEMTVKSIALVPGNYSESAASATHDMLFFLTEVPDRMYARQFGEDLFLWEKEPSADYPEFTSVYADGNKVYCGYGNGKIAGFADVSGQQMVSTPVMMDSVPERMIVTGDYIVGDFRVKNKPSRSLSVFYKTTGARFQRAVYQIEVVDFYKENNEKELLIFGNEDGKAVVSNYFFEGNYFKEILNISDEKINATCRVSSSVFLFSQKKSVFSIDLKTHIKKELLALNDEIVSVKFDETEQIVIVATANSVYSYFYPSMQFIGTFSSLDPIIGIELRYAF